MSDKTYLIILLLTFAVSFGERRSRSTKDKESGSLLLPTDEENGDGTVPRKNKTLRKGELYLPEDYNKFEIPDEAEALGFNPSALIVRVHVRVREIQDLNELDGKISVVMDVRLWWTDWQIAKANQEAINPSGDGFVISLNEDTPETKSKKLDPSFLSKIWKPDLFMESLIETSRPEFIAKPIKLVYKSDGTLILQSRLSVTLSCGMDFHYYPADSQECPFRIRSYSFESSELELEWGEPKPSLYVYDRQNTNFEIQLTEPNVELLIEDSLDFDPLQIAYDLFGSSDGAPPPRKNDTFHVLTFSVKARRKMSYHLIQTYIPSVFFIAITWLCFFIPPRMVECRIGITMTTLLTLTAMFASVRESSPIVSYVKAIDIWMIACVIFVFLCLLEFALLVLFGLTKEKEKNEPPLNQNGSEEFELGGKIQQVDSSVVRLADAKKWTSILRVHGVTGRKLEMFIIPFYLFLFALFQFVYWPWLLGSSEFFDWTVNSTFNAPDEQ